MEPAQRVTSDGRPSPQHGHGSGSPGMDSSVSMVQVTSSRGGVQHYILTKSSLRRHVQIIKVDRETGALKFAGTYGRDMFPTEGQALDFLRHDGNLEILATGKYVLGYIVVGPVAMLLVVEKTRVAATLPGNHQVRAVVTSKWHRVPLQAPTSGTSTPPPVPIEQDSLLTPAQREEYTRGMDKITTFPVDGAHYFCETLDLTRPFPSYRPVTQPSWEFVWNRWLTASFRSIGLDFICPALLQGLCEERQLHDFDHAPYSIALISRRGRLHVGPRYKARGLNEVAEPANEIEVEQVVWRKPLKEGQPVDWSRYTWRRGSVPLWWGVHMKNQGFGEAEIKIKEQCTFKGSRRYVRRLQKRYCPVPWLDPEDGPNGPGAQASQLPGAQPASNSCAAAAASPSGTGPPGGDPSLRVPLLFVSLLRKGTPDRDRSETKLAAAFDFIANVIKKEHAIPLQYIALDWHELDKQLGSHELVGAFWLTLKDILPKHGFALGTLTKVAPDHQDLAVAGAEPPSEGSFTKPTERCLSPAGLGWQARWFQQQRGIARYNCADSLDRTNVGSFFGALQVLVEQCRELDIAIAVSPRNVNSIVTVMKRQHVAAAAALSTGGGSGTGKTGGGLQRTSVGPQKTGQGLGAMASGASVQGMVTSGINRLLTAVSVTKGTPKPSGTPNGTGSHAALMHTESSAPDLSRTSAPHVYSQPRSQTPTGTRSVFMTGGGGGGVVQGTGGMPSPQRPGSVPAAHMPARPVSPPVLNPQAVLDQITRTLPAGWEVKIDNASEKLFYVDHNSRTTHWQHPKLSDAEVEELSRAGLAGGLLPGLPMPSASASLPGGGMQGTRGMATGSARGTAEELASDRQTRLAEEEREMCEPLSPWCMLKSSAKAFARRINPDALSAMAELFLVNGDMSAWLYTGSQAMHSERILIFEPENSKLKKAGVGAYGNIMVGIKRRYNNVMMDTERQQQIEIFLGMKHSVYFPSTKLIYKEAAAVPLDNPETDDELDPVSHVDWVPDKSVHGGNQLVAMDLTKEGAAQPGHSRTRNKSYTSMELLWGDKAQAIAPSKTPRGVLQSVMEGRANTSSGITPASSRPTSGLPSPMGLLGAGGSRAVDLLGLDDRADGAPHMHKVVSDPASLCLLGQELTPLCGPSEPSMGPGQALPGSPAALLRASSTIGRTSSCDQLGGAAAYSPRTSTPGCPSPQGSPGPCPTAGSAPDLAMRRPSTPTGTSSLNPFQPALQHQHGSAGSLHGDTGSPRAAANGGGSPLRQMSRAGQSGSVGPTPEQDGADTGVSSSIKQQWRKLADPLGL